MAGRGSTFSFTAGSFSVDPFRAEHSLAVALSIVGDLSPLKGVRVLIVDDNATNCIALEATLVKFGCKVATARSGADGIDLLRVAVLKDEPFELVLLGLSHATNERN